jgi:hypothetical protein
MIISLENLSPDESPKSAYAHSPKGKSKELLPDLLIPRLSNRSRTAIPTMIVMPSSKSLSEAAFQSRCYFRIVVESDGTPTMLMPYWNET